MYIENVKLGKFIVSSSTSGLKLFQIPLVYNIIKNNTLIQYQSQINKQPNLQNIIQSTLLVDDTFILPQMKKLAFYNIKIEIKINNKELILNKYQNIDYLQMDKVYLVFNLIKSSLIISNCDTIIFQEVIIENQNIQNTQANIIIQNSNSIQINHLVIRDIIIENSTMFQFDTNKQIQIDFLEIEHSQFGKDFLLFYSTTSVKILRINITNSSITNGSFFSLKKNSEVIIKNLSAFNITNETLIDEIKSKIGKNSQLANQSNLNVRNIQEQDEVLQKSRHLIFLQGCQTIQIENLEIRKTQNVGIIKSFYLNENIFSFYHNLFMNLTKLQIYDVNITQYDPYFFMFQLNGLKIQISQMRVNQTFIQNNFINLQPNDFTINQSSFENIEIINGNAFKINGGSIYLSQSNFTNISSTQTGAIQCSNSNQLFIEKVSFHNISCNSIENQKDTNCYGGAANLQNIGSVKILNNTFSFCNSQHDGGAIYFNDFQKQQYLILNQNNFYSNFAKYNSGGSIYFKNSNNITMLNNKFDSNKAYLERGGAIVLYNSNLNVLNDNIFKNNDAQIGGAIWYIFSEINQNHIKTNNEFKNNQGYYYGMDIGSCPTNIKMVDLNNKEKDTGNSIAQIFNLSSGNQITEKVYFNFFDEEGNSLKDTKLIQNKEPIEIQKEKEGYQMYISSSQNLNLMIKFGQTLESVKIGGSLIFQLQLTSLYSLNNTQNAVISSNILQNNNKVSIPLILHFRDCIQGEIPQTNDNFTECFQCKDKKYSLVIPNMQKDLNKLTCNTCPNEADSQNCEGANFILKNGYWRESNSSDIIYKCLTNGCSELYWRQLNNSDNLNNCNTNDCTEYHDQRCLKGYIGPLCDSCDNYAMVWGDTYGKKNNQCYLCKEEYEQYVSFLLIFIGYSVYLLHCLKNLINRQIIIFKLDFFRKIDLLITSKTSSQGGDNLFQLKILIHYLQLLSIITSFPLDYPQTLEISAGFLGDPTQTKIMSLDCISNLSDNYPVWVHRLIVKVATVIFQYLIINISLYTFYILKKKKEYAKRQIKTTAGLSFVFIYLFYQPSISKYLLSSFFCMKIGDEYYLTTEMRTKCYSSTYFTQITILVIPLLTVWCFLIPYYFYRKLKEFQKFNSLSNKFNQVMIFGVIYKGYKDKYLHWELFKIYKKLIIMIIINFNVGHEIKLALIIIVVILYTFKLYQSQPHKDINQFEVEKNLMKKLIFTYLLLYLVMNDNTEQQLFLVFGQVIIIAINLQAFYYIIILLFGSIHIVIKKSEQKTLINKLKMRLYRLKQKYPGFLKFLTFRNANLLRVHKLWKVVIKNYRNGQFSKLNNEYPKNKLFEGLKQKSIQDNNILSRNEIDDQEFLFKSTQLQELDNKMIMYLPNSQNTQIMSPKQQSILKQFNMSNINFFDQSKV